MSETENQGGNPASDASVQASPAQGDNLSDTGLSGADAAPDADVQLLDEWQQLDLPSGATINPDGSVTLVLDYPFDLRFRTHGSDTVQVEHFDNLVLRRLTGGDVRKMLVTTDIVRMAMALSLGMSRAKLVMLQNVIDARDEAAARDIVVELLGGLKAALPPQAEETPAGVKLTLLRPVTDGQGVTRSEIIFNPVNGSLRQRILRTPSPLDWGIALATGISPKAAKSLVDSVDGADAMAMNMVVLFLCGSARVASK